MDYYLCDNAECGYITEAPEPERCPLCGGEFFTRMDEDELAGEEWTTLAEQAEERGDADTAVRCFTRGAELEFAAAQCNLGRCYRDGEGVDQDYAQAVRWYRRSAEQKFPRGLFSLGWCYDNGLGVEKDPAEAARWYSKAADGGDVQAQYNLAWDYARGEGVAQSWPHAAALYRKAADQGHADALYSLAQCVEHGLGVEADLDEAARLYAQAADKGVQRAREDWKRLKGMRSIPHRIKRLVHKLFSGRRDYEGRTDPEKN